MCGITGVAGQISIKHERAFKTMLILDTLRGIDSTGVLTVHRDGSHDVAKAIGNTYNLLESRGFDNAMKGIHSILLGHNRYATQGRVSVRNAHPFEFDNVVGVHNGTLKNKYYLSKGHQFDVDSEALYHHIDEKGVEDAIKGLDGAWALVWYNKDEGTLNMLRNNERPLWVTVAKEGQLFWASEPWMLEVALQREQIEFSDPELLPVDSWHKIQVFADGSLGKPHVVPLASRFRAPVVSGAWVGSTVHGPATQPPKATVEKPAPTPGTGVVANVQQQVPRLPVTTTPVADAITKTIDESDTLPGCYMKGEEVKLFVYGEGHDVNGGRYYMCRDPNAPKRNIKMFINQSDKTNLLNKHILAELHTFTVRDRYGLYYKVIHSTVRLPKEELSVPKKVDVPSLEEDHCNAGRFFQNSKGKLVSELEWNNQHGTCGWCTGHVNPTLAFRFTTEGDTICHECAVDPEVKTLVNLVH